VLPHGPVHGLTANATASTNRATYVLVRNMRGDVTAVATLDGRILESYRYTTYGELVSASSCTSVPSSIPCVLGVCIMVPVCTPHSPVPGLQPFSRLGNTALWAGVHRDPHTGWDWMGARVYLPALRQFLSRDPAGYAVSTDEWAYAPGDPWNFVDPTGWSPWKYGNAKQVGGASGGSGESQSPVPSQFVTVGHRLPGDRANTMRELESWWTQISSTITSVAPSFRRPTLITAWGSVEPGSLTEQQLADAVNAELRLNGSSRAFVPSEVSSAGGFSSTVAPIIGLLPDRSLNATSIWATAAHELTHQIIAQLLQRIGTEEYRALEHAITSVVEAVIEAAIDGQSFGRDYLIRLTRAASLNDDPRAGAEQLEAAIDHGFGPFTEGEDAPAVGSPVALMLAGLSGTSRNTPSTVLTSSTFWQGVIQLVEVYNH
jgi:RHS repeat-associated protein